MSHGVAIFSSARVGWMPKSHSSVVQVLVDPEADHEWKPVAEHAQRLEHGPPEVAAEEPGDLLQDGDAHEDRHHPQHVLHGHHLDGDLLRERQREHEKEQPEDQEQHVLRPREPGEGAAPRGRRNGVRECAGVGAHER